MTNIFYRRPDVRQRPRVGDVFEIRLCNADALIGRVASLNARGGLGGKFPMIYLFRAADVGGEGKELPISKMWDGPILLFDWELWTDGYCRRIQTRPFKAGELLTWHCFRIDAEGRVSDEHGDEIPSSGCERFGPVGVYSRQGLEKRVAELLGISLHDTEGGDVGRPGR